MILLQESFPRSSYTCFIGSSVLSRHCGKAVSLSLIRYIPIGHHLYHRDFRRSRHLPALVLNPDMDTYSVLTRSTVSLRPTLFSDAFDVSKCSSRSHDLMQWEAHAKVQFFKAWDTNAFLRCI